MMMKRMTIAVLVGVLSCLAWAVPSEILVDLRLDETSYVVGERVRGVVEVRNMGATPLSVGYSNSTDRVLVEVYRASDRYQVDRSGNKPFVSPFRVKSMYWLPLLYIWISFTSATVRITSIIERKISIIFASLHFLAFAAEVFTRRVNLPAAHRAPSSGALLLLVVQIIQIRVNPDRHH